MQRVYDEMRKYILVQGGDIMKFFTEADSNRDNFITNSELSVALQKIGFVGANQLSENDITSMFNQFDQNRDGRISYSELCMQFSEFSSTKAVKDPSHWAFYIFELIRRACLVTQKSLSALFGINNMQFKGWDDKVRISQEQFLRAIHQLQIPLTPQHEKQLLDLLHSNDAQHGDIDFLHFSDLVGISFQNIDSKNMAQTLLTAAPLAVNIAEQNRKLFRQLFSQMEIQRLTLQNLQIIFRGAEQIGSNGNIALNDFIQKIQSVSVPPIDASLIRDVSIRFPGSPGMVNY